MGSSISRITTEGTAAAAMRTALVQQADMVPVRALPVDMPPMVLEATGLAALEATVPMEEVDMEPAVQVGMAPVVQEGMEEVIDTAGLETKMIVGGMEGRRVR